MFQPGGNLYGVAIGSRLESVEVPHYDSRDPTPNDVLYPVGKWWLNVGNSLWYLLNFTSNTNGLQANWVNFSSNQLTTFVANTGSAIPSANILNVLGSGGTLTSASGNTITIVNATPGTFSPNAVVQIFDDFIGTNYTATFNSQLGWFEVLFTHTTQLDSAHPGVISNAAFSSGDAKVFMGNQSGVVTPIKFGGGAIILNWVVKVNTFSTGTNRYILRLGFGDTENADQVNGVYFEYSDNINAGNWVLKTAAASVRTTVNTVNLVDANYHNFQIEINAAGTSAVFSIDGLSIGTINTNIPTAAITSFVDVLRTAGTIAADSIFVDLFYFTQTLTVPR